MRRGKGPPRGVVLLEVLIAMAILGVVGAAVAAMAVGASDAVHRAQGADADLRRASNFLEAVALWPREDLDRHLGSRRQGAWRLDVQHPVRSLYTVVLTDSGGAHELLHTALFRPEQGLDRRPDNAR
jgi:prepilin-type N-terminal cleavage/methylation domain-containing protein